jgi:hypothetical protein
MEKDTTHARSRWSLRKKLGVASSVIGLVLFAFVAREVVLFFTIKIDPSIDFPAQRNALVLQEAEKRTGKKQPDGKAQWAELEAIVERIAKEDEEIALSFLTSRGEATDQEVINYQLVFEVMEKPQEQLRFDLAHHAFAKRLQDGSLARLARLQQLIGATRVHEPKTPLYFDPQTMLSNSREATRLLGAMLRQAIRDNDAAKAQDALRSLLALGGAIGGQATDVDALVAIAIHSLGGSVIAEEFTRSAPDEAMARALLAEYVQGPRVAPFDFYLDNMQMGLLDAAQWSHSTSGRFVPSALAQLAPNLTFVRPGSDLLSIRYATRKESEALIAERVHNARELSKLPLGKQFDATLSDFRERKDLRYWFLREMCPSLDGVCRPFTIYDIRYDGTLTLLAVHAYAAKHGSPPPTLEALVPEFLPSLPRDRAASEGSFRYKLQSPTAADPRSFLLYSVAFDGVDNQARHHNTPWTKKVAGYDFVINSLQEPEPTPAR